MLIDRDIKSSTMLHEKLVSIKLADNRKLLLKKGTGWNNLYMQKLILPILNGQGLSVAVRVPGSRNASVWKAQEASGEICIKFFHDRGLRDKIPFRKSRSHRAMRGSLTLSSHGFLVPNIIAQGDFQGRLCTSDNFLLTEWIEGLTLYSYLQTKYIPPLNSKELKSKRDIVISAGHLIGKMHSCGIFHGDLRIGNILVRPSGPDVSFYFLDNERTRQFPSGIPMKHRIKNLVQINMTLLPHLTFTDRLRFFKAYLLENPELKPTEKQLLRAIFARTKKRLSEKFPDIWRRHYE